MLLEVESFEVGHAAFAILEKKGGQNQLVRVGTGQM